jgi:hypothetical protein
MPQIRLKTNSPEFDPGAVKAAVRAGPRARLCDMPGCHADATHRAPKDRSLSAYHEFCFDHVQAYNAAWNFFDGMADRDVEQHIVASFYGDRPTWRADSYRGLEAELHRKIHETRFFTEEDPVDPPQAYGVSPAERQAWRTLGFDAPVSFEVLKKRYRHLVKQNHPDHHAKDVGAEDRLKHINMAYTIVKASFGGRL